MRIVRFLAVLLGLVAAELGAAPAQQALAGKIIVLDPGHAVRSESGALINPGARARHGVYERDLALRLAEKVAPLLEAQGARVYVTRTPGNPWRYHRNRQADNRSRALFANSLHAHAYIRLHGDWNRDKSFKGITTFYYRWGSRNLAKALHRSLVTALQHHDNGIHRRSFVSVTAKMPAVLLEVGVLSNPPEGKLMGTNLYQTRIAEAIAEGVVNYFKKSGQ